MLKSNILTSLELLADRKKSTTGKRQSTPTSTPAPPTPTPAPNPSPELPQTTPTPTISSGKTGQIPDLPDEVSSTRRDELFRLLNGYYDQQTQSAEKSSASTTNRRGKISAVPGVIKPADQVNTGSQIMMTDSGKAGTSSNGLIYNPATGQSTTTGKPSNKPSAITVSPTAGIPDDYADLAEIVTALPDFDFSGWDDMTAKQQRNALQKSGLSSEDMMTLLNSATSLETIATVQDIQTNRTLYNLTQGKADIICARLFEIANARIGAKAHALPFSSNARMTRMFLDDLDEQEEALLFSFGYDKSYKYVRTSIPRDSYAKKHPLSKGKYISYNEIDLTDDLNELMEYYSSKFSSLRNIRFNSPLTALGDFVYNVMTGGPVDIKSQDDWKFQDGYTYYYNGIEMRNDDPGNILFGYAGTALYDLDFLLEGAGTAQMISDILHYGGVQFKDGNHDDPHDSAMIQYGYDLYMEDHSR